MGHRLTKEESDKGILASAKIRKERLNHSIESGCWFSKNLYSLRNYLIEKRGFKCEECTLGIWNNMQITLEVHHIDGNRKNNNLNNLLLLCPNCHSQTPTFKNVKR